MVFLIASLALVTGLADGQLRGDGVSQRHRVPLWARLPHVGLWQLRHLMRPPESPPSRSHNLVPVKSPTSGFQWWSTGVTPAAAASTSTGWSVGPAREWQSWQKLGPPGSLMKLP